MILHIALLATLSLSILLLGGCAGKIDYAPPTKSTVVNNQKIVDKPKDVVWNNSMAELGKNFFVINNLDKSSGFINISYSGSPEKYVNCGYLTSYVKNARGERTYHFPAASANERYEIMDPQFGLILVNRQMQLEGRVNLIFEQITPNQTRISANTRYVLQKKGTAYSYGANQSKNFEDSISFNSGASAFFRPSSSGESVECVSNGRLEEEILEMIK